MGVMNFIFGGFRGKSSGKLKRALKKPPSLHRSQTERVAFDQCELTRWCREDCVTAPSLRSTTTR